MANPNHPQNLAIIEPFAPPKPVSSRRLPPPCWSPEETVALIEAYREKWYSLRRGNLRATHWQEVADGVAATCPVGNPKTSIQCRHKMEKLRKRYRAEIQRIGNNPNGRRFPPPSGWVHFRLMDDMELGFGVGSGSGGSGNGYREDEEEGEEEDDEELGFYPKSLVKQGIPISRRFQGNGVRIRLPNVGNTNTVYDDYPPNMNPNYGLGKGMRGDGYLKESEKGQNVVGSLMKRKKIEDVKSDDSGGEVISEMVGAINKLADGFVRMEQMKMEMAKEFESMRMKMEMKRTEMVLESQQKIWGSFMETFKEKKDDGKKVKRMPTPES
uniref:trihelix transcription factor ASIL1-like n=1 Tax=Erigeron canadensis TaxID=72917 RepID=UPI001CB8D7D1|nr:trihelix transcription factor ASIL1-like [Erigeron canadensis]